jgi:hypothetical protein
MKARGMREKILREFAGGGGGCGRKYCVRQIPITPFVFGTHRSENESSVGARGQNDLSNDFLRSAFVKNS